MIKTFEKYTIDQYAEDKFTGTYYKLFTYGSFDIFGLALKKLGFLEDFCEEWQVEIINGKLNFDDIMDDNQHYFSKKIVYLNEDENQFLIRSDKSAFIGEYGGEVHVDQEDIDKWLMEIDAKKYNI